MDFLVWTPAPAEETRVLIRCHPLAPFQPRQLNPGDYVFFVQESVTLQPGESRTLPLDADVTTFGQVNFIQYPLPGYDWYHPAMGTCFSSASGYHRLFQNVRITNVHDHPIIIQEGSAICRIVMESRNIDEPETLGDPAMPAVPLIIYNNFVCQEAASLGHAYYANANLAPCVPLEAALDYVRYFTNSQN